MSTVVLCLCSLFGDLPLELVLEQQVDLIEINHFYEEDGKHAFDQLIFYEWCPRECRNQVLAWRLVKGQTQIPLRDWDRGDYCCVLCENGVLRSVRSAALRESWTQYDPEVLERDIFPQEKRRELLRSLSSGAP